MIHIKRNFIHNIYHVNISSMIYSYATVFTDIQNYVGSHCNEHQCIQSKTNTNLLFTDYFNPIF